MDDAALIVLRGDSGSGKSTVARMLHERIDAPSAWVEQDHIRRIVLREREVGGELYAGLIETTARYCLERARTVILDGILDATRHAAMIRRLAESHDGPSLFYAFDLPFEETLRRHATRPRQSAEFGEAELRSWFHGWQPLGFVEERRIGPEEEAEQIVTRILAELASGPPRG